MMDSKRLAVIGGGNMGGAIARGVVKAGLFTAKDVVVTRRTAAGLIEWAKDGYVATTDNRAAVAGAAVVVFAVKPYQMEDVVAGVSDLLEPDALCVSVATGVSVKQLDNWFGSQQPVVRAMPNTAADVQQSVTALVGGQACTPSHLNYAERLFGALGLTFVIDEALMPAITALASCGIAHALRYLRAAMEAGIEMGLTAEQAAQVTAQTMKGAAQLVLTNHSHPEVEIDKVCTPKGVTIAGVNALEQHGFTGAVEQGILASYNKIVK